MSGHPPDGSPVKRAELSPRDERIQRLTDRLQAGQAVDGAEVAAVIIELAGEDREDRLVKTLVAVRMELIAGRPYQEILEMIEEARP